MENVVDAHQAGARHGDAPLHGGKCGSLLFALCAGLGDAGFRLLDGGELGLEGELLQLIVLLGAKPFLIKGFRAVQVGLHARQVGLVVFHAGLHGAHVLVGGFQFGFGGAGIGLGGSDGRFLDPHIRLGLNVFDLGQQLALADVVALFHQQLRDVAHGVGADIDVVLGLYFTRGGDYAGEILACDAAGLHRDHAALAIHGAGIDPRGGHQDRRQSDDNLPLRLHDKNLPLSLSPQDAIHWREFTVILHPRIGAAGAMRRHARLRQATGHIEGTAGEGRD